MANSSKVALIKIVIMTILMMGYSIAEIAVSLYLSSLVMFTDGLHNLSDGVSLIVAYWAEKKKRQRGKNARLTFGWRRTELLGGLSNGLFLISMAVFSALQVIPEFVNPSDQDHLDSHPLVFVYVAGIGIAFNIIGVVFFAGHGHSHSHGGGHGHSHSSHSDSHAHSHSHSHTTLNEVMDDSAPLLSGDASHHSHSHGHGEKKVKVRDHNTWGLFIHFLSDVFTSILVLIVGLLAYFYPPTTHKWVLYLDPATTVIAAFIILLSAWPLVKSCSWILLQSSPPQLDLQGLRHNILKLDGVVDVHNEHYWQLVDGLTVASLHVMITDCQSWPRLSHEIRKILHSHGIHSPTIQPEFVQADLNDSCAAGNACIPSCSEEQCCSKKHDDHDAA